MAINKGSFACVLAAAAFAASALLNASPGPQAADPGARPGPSGAGGPVVGLTLNQIGIFNDFKGTFEESDDVPGGLGPRMNLDSCAGCHAHPASGGSSPATNPQVGFATKDGGTDVPPSFISAGGPVRVARFVRNRDGSPDGGVHELFTIAGRTGAPGTCSLTQPDFDRQLRNGNVIFRIPTPVFGAGLIEQIPDSAILANQAANSPLKRGWGIGGRVNHQRTIGGQTNNNGNDGTISRFGWKAQNKSLLLFAGEAYNVEQGESNELFPSEREEGCQPPTATVPNDFTHTDVTGTVGVSDIERFAIFMRFLAPPAPSATLPGGAPSIARGSTQFDNVGCALCHTRSFTTGNSAVAALSRKPVNLFSDLLTHDMGEGLADGVSQGEAGPSEFRSAPLWGLGKRLFLLHDGRATDLLTAIRAHRSRGSEANVVIENFNALGESQKQDLLNFLRSL